MTRSPAGSEVGGTRERLIAATTRLMCERGLVHTSTRDIARAAGVAEGALYHHFADKAELLLAVIQAGMGEFKQVVENLALQVGRRSVRANLEQVAGAALEFHLRVAPMVCSLYSDRALLLRVRQILDRQKIGPGDSAVALAAYLEAEQRLGRVAPATNARAAAELLLAGCFQAAMREHFSCHAVPLKHGVRDMVGALLEGLAPHAVVESRA
ncbi:MAG TPA: helix-turn-helix domain-containing protein [Burkholderiales bacterium]|nr:helix-turn-helix domain-containing protein [Burkholderiales bacterium]